MEASRFIGFHSTKQEARRAYITVRGAQRVGKLLLGHENVKLCQKVMAGEDSPFYQQLIPAIMLSTGNRNEEVGSVHPPHSPYFFLDEGVLPVGAPLHAALAESYLDEHQHSVHVEI